MTGVETQGAAVSAVEKQLRARRAVAARPRRDIDGRCGEAFWRTVAETVGAEFRAGRFTEGIVAGVRAVGDELARHFPRSAGETDRNELPDGVSRG